MNNKQLLKYLWLVVVLMGYPGSCWIASPSTPFAQIILRLNAAYETLVVVSMQTTGTMVYALAFLALLIWSCVRWVKAPSLKTLLWTLFTGWVLCGFPGMVFLWLIGSSR